MRINNPLLIIVSAVGVLVGQGFISPTIFHSRVGAG